ncbi:DUF2264 domain-containing protein [uncultured Enterococcus sp.]|uniref:DUF2264 domain-containing protein n=1 Tax=uncultured Enterococcus sp. TaxID=167972 RepID=UPI002AA72CFB|nr:DUF2264 domain-containing protein [uncultured Enterococcus sp.]
MKSISYSVMETKEEFRGAFQKIVQPAIEALDPEHPGLLNIGSAGAIYSKKTREAEGFLRLLWGYGPFYSQRPIDATFTKLLNGICEGVNPASPDYWGKIGHVDQLMVEMAPLAVFLIMNKEKVESTVSEKEHKQIVAWMNQINAFDTAQNNWLFFRILVNVCLYKNYRMDTFAQIEKDFAKIETFYLGNGWYYDGVKVQIDYYISFAIHYYSLLYAVLFAEEDPQRSLQLKKRAVKFAETFQHWFDDEGRGIPFGRSLTYRFAQSSFWSAMLFAKVEGFNPKKSKALLSKNLAFWLSQDIFSSEGLLRVGYCYDDLVMSEEYNAPGSPYWALKAFLVLALPEEDPIWSLNATISDFTASTDHTLIKEARMLLRKSSDGKEVQAFPVGQFVELHTHGEAKYGKFVYSTLFGFNVSKGLVGYEKGGFDNVLAVSERDNFYRVRTTFENYRTENAYVAVSWKPWEDVLIQSCIIPFGQWHFRIHKINSQRELNVRDGGFSVPYDGVETIQVQQTEAHCFLDSAIGVSGVVNLIGQGCTGVSARLANVNVLYNNVVFPYLSQDISKGETMICTAFLGDGQKKTNEVEDLPEAVISGNSVILTVGKDEKTIELPFT